MSDQYEGDSTTVRRLAVNPPLQQDWGDKPHTTVAVTDETRSEVKVVSEPADLRASIISEAAFHYMRAYEEVRHGNDLLRVVDQAHGQELERLVRELRQAAEDVGSKT